MSELITAVPTGFVAFTATNLDDIVILLLFFSQVNAVFRRRHIVMGQYLGFGGLVLASLPAFLGGLMVPQAWIGLLGIVPIAIGISRLLNQDEEDSTEGATVEPSGNSPLSSLLSPQTYGVAAVTFANGGDNIGIYVPLFANCTWDSLLVILSVFSVLVGALCYSAYQLTRVPAIAESLTRYGSYVVPFVLIGLGVTILVESHTLERCSYVALPLLVCWCGWILLNRNGGLWGGVEES